MGCASASIPPVPDELRRIVEQESSCVACHGTGSAPPIAPGETRTPDAHPTFDAEDVRRAFDGEAR